MAELLDHLAGMEQQTAARAGDGTLVAAVLAGAAARPGKAALRLGRGPARVEITYGELMARIERGASRLRALGVRPGDRIALFSENGPAWLPAFFAILEARGTVVPVDRQLKEPDVRVILDASEARALLASPSALATLSRDMIRSLSERGVPVRGLDGDLEAAPGAAATCAARPSGPDDRDPAIASLIFTAGTTGRPKGVMLTHENLLASERAARERLPLVESDELLSILPLHHIFAFMSELHALLTGATLTYIEAIRADVILEAMRETRTTAMAAVPRLLELFHAGIERKVAARGATGRLTFATLHGISRVARVFGVDLRPRLFGAVHGQFGGRLRVVLSGAAALPPDLWHALDALGFPIVEGYGLTETSAAVACHGLQTRRPGTVGRPASGLEVRIARPNSTGEGEIAVRGPTVMRGYFRDEAATRAAIRDGWFHTGDLGRIDRDGHLVITGRVKELIVTSAGKNVSPVEVEARYGAIPGVRELCVFGAGGASIGEEVQAALVLEAGAEPDDASRRAIAQRLEARASEAGIPSYMRIQRFHIVPEIPRTTTLKPRRHELRAALAGAAGRANAEAGAGKAFEAGSVEAGVFDVLRAVAKDRAAGVRLDSTLQFDIGLDSLERLDLAAALEARFAVPIPEEVLPRLHTVRDLVLAVQQPQGEPGGRAPADRRHDTVPRIPEPHGITARLALGAFARSARLLYALRAEGLATLPPGPMILCPNHECHLDVFFVASLLPPALRRDLVCFAKREHFDSSGTRMIAALAGAMPVDRDGDVRPALRAAAQALRAGRTLLIHPEGTRTKTGALGPFRAGAALVALECGVPLVPVRITGAFAVFPESRSLPRLFDWRRGRRLLITVTFGLPVAPRPGSTPDTLTGQLREAVAAL